MLTTNKGFGKGANSSCQVMAAVLSAAKSTWCRAPTVSTFSENKKLKLSNFGTRALNTEIYYILHTKTKYKCWGYLQHAYQVVHGVWSTCAENEELVPFLEELNGNSHAWGWLPSQICPNETLDAESEVEMQQTQNKWDFLLQAKKHSRIYKNKIKIHSLQSKYVITAFFAEQNRKTSSYH